MEIQRKPPPEVGIFLLLYADSWLFFPLPTIFPLFLRAPKSPGLTQSIEGEKILRGSACDHVLRLLALSSNPLDTLGACL